MGSYVAQSDKLEDNKLGNMVKDSFCNSDFNYTRPANAEDGHQQQIIDKKLNSNVALESSIEDYISSRIKKNPEFIK